MSWFNWWLKKEYNSFELERLDYEETILNLEKEIELLKRTIALPKDNIIEATREALKGIKVDLSYLDSMPKEEIDDFLSRASNIANDWTFKKITDYLINKQMKFTVEEAQNWEQTKFGRATIFGITLIKDELNALDAMHKDLIKKEEFDEHQII